MTDTAPAAPAPKLPARSVLGVSRPAVTRYRPQIIAIGAVTLLLIFTIALMIGFSPRRPPAAKTEADASKTTGAALAGPDFGGLAKSYADPNGSIGSAPGLAGLPPPEGSLAAPATPAAAAAPPVPPRPIDPAIQQARPLSLAALASNPFFGGAPEAHAVAPWEAPPPRFGATPAAEGVQPTPVRSPAPDTSPNLQGQKVEFVAAAGRADDYVAATYQFPRSPFEVKAGSIIPAALITALNSDLPGEIVAQVTQNVFDHATGRTILIPQGARLVGRYDSQVAYGQSRALIVWTRVIMPDGRSLNLEAMTGADLAGASGLSDRVDPHIGPLTRAIALSTAITVGGAVAENARARSSGNLVLSDATGGVSAQASQVGQRYVDKELNRQPTIKVRPGWPLVVLVSRDLVLAAY